MSSFPVYAVVLVLSGAVVLFAATRASRMAWRPLALIGAAWAVAHVGLAVTPGANRLLIVSNLLVLGSAALGGAMLARTVRSPGALVTLAVTASIVDIVSFSGGPTRWLLSSELDSLSVVLRYLAVTTPSATGTVAVVGIGDLALLGCFFLGLRVTGRSRLVVGSSLVGALLVALVVGLLRGGAFGIPFMAAVVVALSLRSQEESPGEPCPG
ncbi:MAG: hypothetical protein PVI57_14915 [Gemmatimonadota bacterium]|jgi:hypothetical protein